MATPDDAARSREMWREIVSAPLDITAFQPPPSSMSVEMAAESAAGTLQAHNTDHYLAIRFGRLQETLLTSLSGADLPPHFEEYSYGLALADGLGGQGMGVRASRVALSALAHLSIRYGRWNVRATSDTFAEIAEQGAFFCRQVNEAVNEARRADFRLGDIATSLTSLYIAGANLFYLHVGHSRAFLFRGGVLTQLTVDQTLEQLRLDTTRPLLLDHSKQDMTHVVIETIGARLGGPDAAIEHVHLFSGDRLLSCTNGLTDVLSCDEIAGVLALRRRPSDDCRQLVGMALARGAADNVTVLMADYSLRATERAAPMGPSASSDPL